MVKCHEIMTENPVCCLSNDSIESIAQWMRTEDIGAVPVVTDYQSKRLSGIVTDRDLALRVIGAGRSCQDTKVGDVMTHDPINCRPSDDLSVAMETMAQHQVRRLPIVDNNGQLVGIITQADLVTRLRDPHKATDVVQEVSQPNPIPVR